MGDVGVNITTSNDRAGPVVNQNLYVSDNWLPTANLTLGKWTLGQQGSALYGVTGGAESVGGLDGLGTFLAPGISYAGGGGGVSYTIALFPPNSQGFTPIAGVAGAQNLPDLHATLSTAMGGMTIGLGGYAREYGITQTGGCGARAAASCGGETLKTAFGITAGISTSLGGNTLNIGVAHGSAPRGMGNYENWSRAEGEQFSVDGAGAVAGTDHSVVTVNLKHPWGGAYSARSTIGATMQTLDVAETNTAATMVRSQQAIANIFWSPVAAVNIGLEVNWITVIRKGQNPKEGAGLFFKASSSF
jgi:flagellin-like hook-associated protein FlgL